MAAPDLNDLVRRIERSDFFQAVRLIELRALIETHGASTGNPSAPFDDGVGNEALARSNVPAGRVGVGLNAGRIDDPVRFAAETSVRFPETAISAVEADRERRIVRMLVTFFGTHGPSGTLPPFYTRMIQSLPRDKPNSLRDFLDLFNHRATSYFYRAWRKSRYDVEREAIGWSSGRRALEHADPFSERLLALVGWRSAALRAAEPERFREPGALLHFAGHHSRPIRSAALLRRMISERLNERPESHEDSEVRTDVDLTNSAAMACGIVQCAGRWEPIDDQARTRMSAHAPPQLGVSTTVGDRVWMATHRFVVRIGPVDWDRFRRLVPGGDLSASVARLARRYVQEPIGFALQVVLRREALAEPVTRLGGNDRSEDDRPTGSRLGIDCWLVSLPLPDDSDAPVFDERACLGRSL